MGNPEAGVLYRLGNKRVPTQTRRMNRLILPSVTNGAFHPLPADYQTITVRVSGRRPVFLILSCYRSCRWRVEVAGGTVLAGVLVLGYEAHERPQLPPLTRYCDTSGHRVRWPAPWGYPSKPEGEKYDQFVRSLATMFDKLPRGFVGEYRSRDSGYDVRSNDR